MLSRFVAVLLVLAALLGPASAASADPVCDFPIKPHWCES
jgi:hypothetical protein